MSSRTCQASPSASSCFAAMPSGLRLDMSFNRFPQGTFANDVDPLTPEPAPSISVAPSLPCDDISMAELAAELDAFKFPVRTDGVRGLLWGPFKDEPDTDGEEDVPTLIVSDYSSRMDSSWSATTQATQILRTTPPCTKQQRIFPILRAPLIIRIKPTLKRRRESTDEDEDQCDRAAKVGKLCQHKDLVAIVQVAFALQPVPIPQRRSRITLNASSRIKYCC